MEEIFKIYKKTTDRWGKRVRVYEVSNFGRCKINGELVEPRDEHGYLVCGKFYVHNAVAELFIFKPVSKKLLEVDHIDTDRHNNRVDNLRWVTRSENLKNPITSKRRADTLKRKYSGINAIWYGRRHTESSKEKIRQAQAGKKYSDEVNAKKGGAKGTFWMNNGIDQMRVFPPWDQDMLIFGWQYGRLNKAWNKGLTKETDERIAKYGEKISEKRKRSK